jgi:hypothetical protein
MRFYQSVLAAAGAASLAMSASAGIQATATYTDTLVSAGVYQYDLTLKNTGSTTIGTYWFAWVPGAGFLSVSPTAVASPAGWSDVLTNAGDAIQWKTGSSLLAPGASLTGFSFDSTQTPAELSGTFAGPGAGAGDPITTSFVYIAAPLADPGAQFVTTAARAAAAPEPATFGLIGLGLAGIGFVRRRRTLSTPA